MYSLLYRKYSIHGLFRANLRSFSSISSSALLPAGNCVISSASRGIGLGFTKHLLAKSNYNVILFTRHLQEPEHLSDLRDQYGANRVKIILDVDLEEQEKVEAAAKEVKEHLTLQNETQQHSTGKVDLLLNVAGILGDQSPSQPGPERSIMAVQRDWLEKSMEVVMIYIPKRSLTSYNP